MINHAIAAFSHFWVSRDGTWNAKFYAPECEQVFGYREQELLANPDLWRSRVFTEDFEQAILPSFKAVIAERTFERRYRFLHRDGMTRWIAETLSSQWHEEQGGWQVTVLSSDITHTMRIEEAHQQWRHQIHDVLSHVPAVIYRAVLLPRLGFRFTWISEKIWELADLTAEEVCAHPAGLFDLIHPDDRPQFDAALSLATVTRQPLCSYYRILTASNQVKWVQDTAQFSHNDVGELVIDGVCLSIEQHPQLLAQKPFSSRERVFEGLPTGLPTTSQGRSPLESEQAAIALLRNFSQVIQQFHQNLPLHDLLEKATAEIRHLIQIDRVVLAQVFPGGSVVHVTEAATPHHELVSTTGTYNSGLRIDIATYQRGNSWVVDQTDDLPETVRRSWKFSEYNVRAALVVPILVQQDLWGLLLLHQCHQSRPWSSTEVEVVQQLAVQLGVAIYHSEQHHSLYRQNSELERKFQLRNAQLQLAFEFEETLKRITDKVRDSLDEDQILQTAVRELTLAIGVSGCNAALYDLEKETSTVHYEYTTAVSPSQGRVAQMKAFPELYDQLLNGHSFQFCSIVPNPVRGHVAMLACPILDDQDVLGDLWLIHHKFYAFHEQDIRLVQQVANQCAIALRQARLYHAAQAQVAELERLNRLKDDFLSTVSHELRTPIASIKMASQMLELTLSKAGLLDTTVSPIARYLQILQGECNREISLVNDLLDLSRLEVEAEPITLTSMPLQDWVADLMEPFIERTEKHQQQLQVNIPVGLTSVVSDFSKLDRILSELLQNACKYTPAKEKIQLSIQVDGTAIQISVSNTGVEIPLQERSRIFEKFYRIPNTKDPWKHGGTGLGLALVKKLVEQLHGTITVDSGNNETQFQVRIPRQVLPRLSNL